MTCRFDKEGKFSELPEKIEPLVKRTITWDLIKDTEDIPGKAREVKALKRAFFRIGLKIPVRFRYVEVGGDISITVSGTDNYFKDRPNALAYAFLNTMSQPIDIVFNESYIWILNKLWGTNRYNFEVVALHEICHVLGLRHSSSSDSIMFPSYQGIFKLSDEDVQKLQEIHGIRSNWSELVEKLKGYLKREI